VDIQGGQKVSCCFVDCNSREFVANQIKDVAVLESLLNFQHDARRP